MNGLIFDIHRFFMGNGNGIRTVIFFKGCPLHCPWCCNPEGQNFELDWARMNSKCIHCSRCCYNTNECPSGAITEIGRYVTVEDIIKEIEKDIIFYNTSGGGVTLSGGEILSQWDFSMQLLKKLKSLGINTIIETSGQGRKNNLLSLAAYCDLVIFDLKIMNKARAANILWADAEIIENNLRALVETGKNVIPRISLVSGYTIDEENLDTIISLFRELEVKETYILPFQHYGSNKYEYIGRIYSLKDTKPLSEIDINRIKAKIEEQGIRVIRDSLKVSTGIIKIG